ncbi:MAG: class I SAM-dependent methyltransferase [Fibrobacterota bacterium]
MENRFDLIMFSEVMEHLPTAPELVLLMFTRMLKPGGCILLSTPNRTTIRSRARMLIGRNPEKRIRCFSANPGHFREYTASELREIASAALLEVVFVRTINFNSPAGDIFAPLKVFPAFRDSLMAVFQRPR